MRCIRGNAVAVILCALSFLFSTPTLLSDGLFIPGEEERQDTLRGSLIALPWAKKEVAAIAGLIGGETFLGQEATEENFKKFAGKYGIIHLATHALIDDAKPMFSKFVFSNTDSQGEDDGYLNTYELYAMELNAELAVLSACNTGFGKFVRGEGIMNMARGFLYAGCPSVVVSLWQVSDSKSTSTLMTNFYDGLAKGKRKDEALRDAKLQYLETASPVSADPFYWAGFVPIGNTDPLSMATTDYTGYALGAAALLVAIVVLLLLRRRWLRAASA